MATEKQAAYIKNLVNGLRVENMEWVKVLTLTGNRRDWKIQRWIDGAMKTSDYENEIDFSDTLTAYNARLDEIAASVDGMDTKAASRAIDNLKNCTVVW